MECMITVAIGIMSLCAVFVTVNPLLNHKLKKDIDARLKEIEEKQKINEMLFEKMTIIFENLEEIKRKKAQQQN